jgi:hypothetical protein
MPNAEFDQICLEIARIKIRLRAADQRWKLGLLPEYLPFVCTHECDEPADLDLTVYCEELPEISCTDEGFHSGGAWAMEKSGDRFVFRFESPSFDPPVYKLVIMSADFSHSDIYIRPVQGSIVGSTIFPIEFPLDELLVNHWLSKDRGVELHACAINFDGRALVCCGQSGAGKSTMARLWEEARRGEVLSDERVIIRDFGELEVYGTPWRGEARMALNNGCPVKAIFVLEHGPTNHLEPLKPADAASYLVARSFPTFWDSAGMEGTLDFIQRIVERIPCFKLGFVPDESVVSFLKSASVDLR